MRGQSIGWFVAFTLAAGCASAGSGEETPGATPENTEWRLLGLAWMPASGSAPTLRLDSAQRQASGNTGCNSFSGPYELRGDSLRFGALASTRRACLDPQANRQETAFLDALSRTRTWRIAADTLVLSGEHGRLARFRER